MRRFLTALLAPIFAFACVLAPTLEVPKHAARAPAAAVAYAFAPAQAQAGGYFFPGSSAATNPNETYELIGWDAVTNATGTTVATHASNHTKGNWVDLGTASADLSMLYVRVHNSSASNIRILFDLGTDNSTANLIANVSVFPTAVNLARPIEFPLPRQVASGTHIYARAQASLGTNSISMSIRGVRANSTTAPGFTSTVALTAVDTTSTRACSTTTPLTGAGSPLAWTELVPSTAAQYGAILLGGGSSSVNPGTAQAVNVSLATGTAGNEVAFGWGSWALSTSDPRAPAKQTLIQKTIAASQRITANVQGTTPGAGPDTICLQLFGFPS